MFGSDGSRPIDYKRAVVVEAEVKENETGHSLKRIEKCAQKGFDRVGVVRDVR